VLVRGVPAGGLEPIVFRMDALYRLATAGVRVVNAPKAIEACVDKYLATARLSAAGLPVPRTEVCERADDAMAAFERLGADVVLKPLFGSEGRGILRIDNVAVAERVFKALASVEAVLYLQEFVRHPGHDVRALVIGDRVTAAMRRRSNGDFRTNVARGGSFEACELSEEWSTLAVAAAKAVGAEIAGVDLLPDANGKPLVVEVNSTPGFKAIAQVTSVDLPQAIVRFVTECS
jgi:ribosomal protein S6--L-glutamate ligase